MGIPFYFVFAVLGILVGSFLNVLIWRIPRGETIFKRRQSCRICGQPLKNMNWIPILGDVLRSVYALLHGKCRTCRTWIDWRDPTVELVTGVLFILIYLCKNDRTVIVLAMDMVFIGSVVALAVIDLDTFMLPDRLIALVAVLGLVNTAVTSDISLKYSLIGALCAGLIFLLIAWVYPQGMGMGDVKFVAALGLYFGIGITLVIYIASALGVIIGGFCVLINKRDLRDPIPFGPFMAIGAIVTLYLNDYSLSLLL